MNIDFTGTNAKRVSLRPAGVEPAEGGASALPTAGAPLVRRRRRRRRGLGAFLSSGGLHLLVLVLLLVTHTGARRGTPEDQPSVVMVFGHNGSAGLTGASVPQTEQGTMEAPETAVAPEPLPPPAAEAPAPTPTPPAPAPAKPPPVPQPREQRVERVPTPTRPRREVRRSSRSSNPFQNLTDLSLTPEMGQPSTHASRRGRGGSGAAVNLSIGPLVQGGRMTMPFSIRGANGMTSDYESLLDDWVNRHKYYPQSAADRGHDGQVSLHVVWDRDGKVLSVRVNYGSGDTDLDDAWVGLFRGAHLPPPPPDVPGDPIEYDMIMNYELLH